VNPRATHYCKLKNANFKLQIDMNSRLIGGFAAFGLRRFNRNKKTRRHAIGKRLPYRRMSSIANLQFAIYNLQFAIPHTT